MAVSGFNFDWGIVSDCSTQIDFMVIRGYQLFPDPAKPDKVCRVLPFR